MRRRHSSIIILALIAACSSGQDTTTDAGNNPNCAVDGGCVPCGARGNELHVGEYCTRGGGQCDDNGIGGNAILCTVDFQPTAPVAMCTRVCRFNSECGSNAICAEDPMDPSQKACVPTACAPGHPGIEPDAGAGEDAAAAD